MKTLKALSLIIVFTKICILQACGQTTNSQQKKDPQAEILEQLRKQEEIKAAVPKRHKAFLSRMQGTWTFYDTSACVNQAKNKYGTIEYGLGLRIKLIVTDSTYTSYVEEFLPDPKKEKRPIEEVVVKSEGRVKLTQGPNYSDDNLDFAVVNLLVFHSLNSDFDPYNGRILSWDNLKQTFALSYYRGENCKFTGYFEKAN